MTRTVIKLQPLFGAVSYFHKCRNLSGIPCDYIFKLVFGYLQKTSIEGNAMKKLVSLYLSMLLICPMGAQAASVPSIIGALSWTMDSLPIYMIFTQMQCVPSFIPPEICIPYPTFGAGTITAINASVTDQIGRAHV